MPVTPGRRRAALRPLPGAWPRPGHAPHAPKPLSALLTVWAQARHGPIVSGEQQFRKLPHVAHRKRQALAVDWIVVSSGVAEKNYPVRHDHNELP
jgi:hypothetical protein